MLSKSELDEDDYKEKYESIKNNLVASKNGDPQGFFPLTSEPTGYFSWIDSRKKEIEIDDWRYLIY